MLLSIIIVSYNTKELTLQTLRSVFDEVHTSAVLKNKTEVLVVDNDSTDDSVALMKKEFGKLAHFTIIQNTENAGFAKANNLAIEKSTGKYILLLNSDTIVSDSAIEKMVQTFEELPIDDTTAVLASQRRRVDRLGVLAAQLKNVDGSIQAQGGSFPTLVSLFCHMFFLDDLPVIGRLFPSTQYTGRNARTDGEQGNILRRDWVGGTAMMFRKLVIEEVGPLDQNIFMYGEDVEFCMRAQFHHWDVALSPAAQITHLGSASSNSANAIKGEIKGYLYIWSKHKPLWQLPLAKAVLWGGCALRVFVFQLLLGNKQKAQPYVYLLENVLR
jgi:N-acetylglucosaminyl-diphospho-decaprenol L-rhamnosyltransferase